MNLFPTITKFDLTHGRTRMAGRKQRIKKYMENTNQWIPLTGPGGRLPTIEDANDAGFVWMLYSDLSVGYYEIRNLNIGPNSTHFYPIAKRPPLPKPVEKTQQEKDVEKSKELWPYAWPNAQNEIVNGIRYGRSDGRAQLARECLGLFKGSYLDLDFVASVMKQREYPATASSVFSLHALLTKAAEEKTP